MSDLVSSAPAVMDADAAAWYLGTTPRHLRRLRSEHGLPYRRIGSKIRYLQADLDQFLERSAANDRPGAA